MIQEEPYGMFIHQIHNIIEKNVNNQLRKKRLTLSQMNVLIALVSVSEKKLSFKELEKRLTLAQSTTAGLISRLEQKGLVSVLGDEDDKRIKYVEITGLGIEYCEEARLKMNDTEEKIISSLSETERKTFLCLLKKINDTLVKN
ncbi:MAG: MarR family transcriptional regulator [Lachnospiraceae bacterium]|nr:MarR family transcriptional regulator [Lachnospiraceae bacterium]